LEQTQKIIQKKNLKERLRKEKGQKGETEKKKRKSGKGIYQAEIFL